MSFTELKIEPLASELEDELKKLYVVKRVFVKVGEAKWFLPYKYVKNGNQIYTFKVRPDDTWIITYPRSGTTVTQELIWLVANDLNFDEALQRSLAQRFPFIDLSILIEDDTIAETVYEKKTTVNYVQDQPSPRFIKSHMPFDLLPTVENSDCKVIYVARNPKDVVVSWYHFQILQKHMRYLGTFEHFCDMFLADHTIFSPYWKHVKEGWAKRHRPNTLFLFYEDLTKDLPGVIKKTATFFGKSYSEEQIAKLAEHLNIDNFRKNPMVNQSTPNSQALEEFIRQGKTGGWKEVFTPEMDEKFNKWIADNLRDTDLTFPS